MLHLLDRLILRRRCFIIIFDHAGVDHEDAIRDDHADTAGYHDPPPHTRGEHLHNIY